MHLTLKSHGGFKTYSNADYVSSESGEVLYKVEATTAQLGSKKIIRIERRVRHDRKYIDSQSLLESESDSEFQELATITRRYMVPTAHITYMGKEYEEKDVFRQVNWWNLTG
jgi:hypothetical protein